MLGQRLIDLAENLPRLMVMDLFVVAVASAVDDAVDTQPPTIRREDVAAERRSFLRGAASVVAAGRHTQFLTPLPSTNKCLEWVVAVLREAAA
jgi:hypothetical protein